MAILSDVRHQIATDDPGRPDEPDAISRDHRKDTTGSAVEKKKADRTT
jgi:hypothetical protein